MRQTTNLFLLFFLIGLCAKAQIFRPQGNASSRSYNYNFDRPSQPNYKWAIAFPMSDIVVSRYGLDVEYQLDKGHALAFGLSSIQQELRIRENIGWNTTIRTMPMIGSEWRFFHRYYFSGVDGLYMSILHGFSMISKSIPYYVEAWRPFTEDGITYYRIEEDKVGYDVLRLGYDFRLSAQLRMDRFFIDGDAGLGYRWIVDESQEPDDFRVDPDDFEYSYPNYVGLVPVLRVRIGLFLDPMPTGVSQK